MEIIKRKSSSHAQDSSVSGSGTEQEHILASCNNCGACVSQCSFLQKLGSPREICSTMAPGELSSMAYECSLCGLCTQLCPEGCDPARLFLEMRRQAAGRGKDFKQYKALLGYEQRGTSPRFTYYALPQGCKTVFFPGCNLPGSRPEITKSVFTHLQGAIPDLGLVMDCCCKPSHDLGRMAYFEAMFHEMLDWLKGHGVEKILCACPNCYKVFSTYGQGLEVETVYTLLEEQGLPQADNVSGQVCVHDPCPLRNETDVHAAIRNILAEKGLAVQPQKHEGTKTLCCGEGGAISCVAPDLASSWTGKRVTESQGAPLITYCAGCAGFLGRQTPTHHVLDLVFQPSITMKGKARVASSPVTYWNRLKLKQWFQSSLPAVHSRERVFTPPTQESKAASGDNGRLLVLLGGMLSGFQRIRN